jgi:predicted O-methyltransferase YrrM
MLTPQEFMVSLEGMRASVPDWGKTSADYSQPGYVFAHAMFLAGLASEMRGAIVEIGTDQGIGIAALAYGAQLREAFWPGHYEIVVRSFEVDPNRIAVARERLAAHGFWNAEVINRSERAVGSFGPIGFAFVDAAHDFHNCLADMNEVAEAMPDGTILVHDFVNFRIYGKEINGVPFAVSEFLKTHPDWHCSVHRDNICLLDNCSFHPEYIE